MTRPNILLITTDQQRWDALGISGNPILRTPNLDALAASGMRFSRAYSTCPVCIPARRSLLSGLHPVTHGLRGYQDGLDFDPPTTLPGRLSEAGYQTQLVGKIHLHPQRKRYGFDHMVLSDSPNDRPDSPYQKQNDYPRWLREQGLNVSANAHGLNSNGRVARPWHLPEEFHQSAWLAREATEFLTQTRDPSCPWFLHLSFTAPHPPLNPPQAYWDRYHGLDGLRPRIGEWAPRDRSSLGRPGNDTIGPFPAGEMADAMAGYYGLIHQVDDCVCQVLDAYREYGTARCHEPILVVFTSDHGEMLGDHHLFRKSLPYEASSHVPFFISGINFPVQQGVSEELVSLEDIMPTLLDLGGAAPFSSDNTLDGINLAPIVRGESTSTRQTLYGECSSGFRHHFLIQGDFKYIWYAQTHEEQLFNLREDPWEERDLSGQADRLAPFRKALAEHLADRDDYTFESGKLTPCLNQPPKALFG